MLPLKRSILVLNGGSITNITADNVDVPGAAIGPSPSNNFGANNIVNIQPTDSITTVVDKISTYLENLTNASFVDAHANTIIFSMANSYSAYSSMIGPSHLFTNVCGSNKPITNTVEFVYDNGGVVSVLVKLGDNNTYTYVTDLINTSKIANEIHGGIPHTPPLDNTQITFSNYLNILYDALNNGNYTIAATVGGASSTYTLNAGTTQFSYQLKHVNDTNIEYLSPEINFYVDNPVVPTVNVSAPTYGIIGVINTGLVSGIPCLKNGDDVTVKFQAVNCFKAFYNKNWVAKLTGVNVFADVLLQAPVFVPGIIPPSSGVSGVIASGGLVDQNVVYQENIQVADNVSFGMLNTFSVQVVVQNSRGDTATGNLIDVNGKKIIVDSKSTAPKSATFINEVFNNVLGEVNRVKSGLGLFPSMGGAFNQFSNTAFDSSVDLSLSNTRELVLFNGYYSMVSGSEYNFVTARPAGPNYSNLPNDLVVYDSIPLNVRWATFAVRFPSNSLTSAERLYTSITFTINSLTDNFTSASNDAVIDNLLLFICIRDSSTPAVTDMPWFDANKAGINPMFEGDGCLDVNNSSKYIKRISCGKPQNPRMGTIYVRVGLPVGSLYKIIGITY